MLQAFGRPFDTAFGIVSHEVRPGGHVSGEDERPLGQVFIVTACAHHRAPLFGNRARQRIEKNAFRQCQIDGGRASGIARCIGRGDTQFDAAAGQRMLAGIDDGAHAILGLGGRGGLNVDGRPVIV